MVAFTLPTSRRITQNWNMDFKVLNGKFYPNGFYASIGWLGHNGIDYGCPEGDDVEAVCDGVIEYVGPANNHPLLTGGGNALLLRNDELGIRFEYLHLSQQNVYTGQKVKRGQVIARSGNTGISSGAHLHLGAIPLKPNLNNGYRGRVDPTGWLYGPSNPDYAGGLAAQGTITQPAQEDDVSADEVWKHPVERTDGKESTAIVELARMGPKLDQLDTVLAILGAMAPEVTESMINDRKQVHSLDGLWALVAEKNAPAIVDNIVAAGLAEQILQLLSDRIGGGN